MQPVKNTLQRLKIWRPIDKKYGAKGVVVLAIVAIALVVTGGGAVRALLLGATNGNTTVNLSAGLVAWWKMDGSPRDATPNANNASLVSAPTLTTDRKGKANSAYNFNGTSAYLNVPNANVLVPFSSNISVSAWIKTSTTSGCVVSKRDGGPINEYNLCISSGGKIQAVYCDNNASHYTILNGNTTVTDGNWHLATMMLNRSGNMTIYVDGVLDASTSIAAYSSFSISATTNTLKIGRDAYSAGFFPGSIDDVRIYRRLLTTEENKALYDQYDPGIKAASGEKGLAGWYKMDGNSKDATPYANAGVLAGATLPTLTTDRAGRANSAYSFDGSSSYINGGNGSLYTIGTGNISLCAWIKTSYTASTQVIVNKREAGPSQMYGLAISGGYLFGQFGNGTYANGSTFVADNFWHHTCLTISRNSNMTVYVDGRSDGSVSISSSSSSNLSTTNTLKIGRDSYSAGSYFNGSIDDVRIYRRVLPASEIATMATLYNSQINLNAGGASGTNSVNLNNGLVGEWDFNGNAKDATPYSNNGTVASGTTLDTDRKGRANSAYLFTNSANSYIQVPDAPSLNQSKYTLSIWAYPTSWTSASAATFIAKRSSASTDGYFLLRLTSQSRLSSDTGASGNRSGTTPSYSPPLNQWTHIVVTFDSSRSQRTMFYINGSLYSSAGFGIINHSSTPLRIGNDTAGNNYPFIGKLDDARMYSRALSDAEVTALYNVYK